jgi:hypothetical protein
MHAARSEIHFQNVEAADVAIDGVDDGAFVDEHVIYLDDAGRSARRDHQRLDCRLSSLLRITGGIEGLA